MWVRGGGAPTQTANGLALSFNIYQKAFLIQMGVLPYSNNERDRDWAKGLLKYVHPVTGEAVEAYPINIADPITPHRTRDFRLYTTYLDQPDIWAELMARGQPGWDWCDAQACHRF